jgi:hypothetical protein
MQSGRRRLQMATPAFEPRENTEGSMDRFIRRQNVDRYVRLLTIVTDPAERKKILALLAEERQKQNDAGDPPEEQTLITAAE